MEAEIIQKLFLPEILLRILRTELFRIGNFGFELWKFVHFGAGYILGKIFKDWRTVLTILVLFEFLEFIFWTNNIIFAEKLLWDTIPDIIIGMIGWWFGTRF